MQLNTQIAYLEELSNRYLFASKGLLKDEKVEPMANDLTSFSKKQGFLEVAFYILVHH
jgi:hypothetical protein